MGRHAAAVALALLTGTAALAQGWEPARSNPQPREGDLILPLPCGGAIAFREIVVPAAASPLDDRRVQLGAATPEAGYAEFQRSAFIAGGFQSGPEARRFWLGKYEVTRDQHAAVTQPQCPAPAADGRQPQAGVSWSEAVGFAEKLTVWLLANARARLPAQDGAPGFVRLPTEEEWEYAARGGAAVSEAEFIEPVFPMPEGGPEDYVMAGAQRTGNRAQAVGQLKPNPLGLHDMLGNVAEMTLEPFRLNRVGRLHGQAGGVVARGGSYGGTPEEAHTAARDELPPYDARTGQPTRLPQVGFRVALAVQATTSLPQTERLRAAFAAEAGRDRDAAQAAATDPRAALELLRRASSDAAQQAAIGRIEAQLATDARARADQQREVVRAQIDSLAMLAFGAREVAYRATLAQRLLDNPEVRQQLPAAEIATRQEAIAELRRNAAAIVDSYIATIRRVAEGAPRTMVAEQTGIVRAELRARNLWRLGVYMDGIDRHVRDTQLGRAPERDRLAAEFEEVAARPPRR